MWWDKLIKARDANIKSFTSLNYFIKNIKPKNLLTTDEYNKIEKLIKNAFSCHLDKSHEENQKKKKIICEICKTKKTMIEYECNIFDKTMLQDENTVGTWNPCYQENILRG